MEEFLYHRSSIFVYNPVVLVLRVFLVSVGCIGAERLASLSLCLEHRTDVLARVFGIPFIDDIEEWRKIAVLLTVTVDPVIDGNKADIRFREHHLGIVTDL